MGTVIDFQSRRVLRGAGAADPLERLRAVTDRLDPLVRSLDVRSLDAGVAAEELRQIRAHVDALRLPEAAGLAEELLRRLASKAG